MKLSQLTDRTVKHTVEIPDVGKIELEFKANLLTPKLLKELDGKSDTDALLDFLCEYLVGWDLTDDDEKIVEISKDTLEQLDGRILEIIRSGMFEGSSPNPKTGSI